MNSLLIELDSIDLCATLIDCAQCFSWKHHADGFAIAINDGNGTAAFYTEERPNGVVVSCAERMPNEAFWRNYFDASRDYSALSERFGWHGKMAAALNAAQGLRVLRQPAWDTVVSFILSANNNVSRITSLTDRISRAYGTPAQMDGNTFFAVPTPVQLSAATEAELRALGCGYRAPYLIETAQKVAGGFDLDALRSVSHAEAHRQLKTLKGVGDKVADCICLFGLQHDCAFPVDVWVERLLIHWFGMEGLSRPAMARRAVELLGCEAGIIQQYLFHCARLGLLGEFPQ